MINQKCYSFKIAPYTQPMSKWILKDLKIPAMDPREAVILYLMHEEYSSRMKNRWRSLERDFSYPKKEDVHCWIRQIIEWTVVKKRGQFQVQYKKTNIYTVHEIMSKFKY